MEAMAGVARQVRLQQTTVQLLLQEAAVVLASALAAAALAAAQVVLAALQYVLDQIVTQLKEEMAQMAVTPGHNKATQNIKREIIIHLFFFSSEWSSDVHQKSSKMKCVKEFLNLIMKNLNDIYLFITKHPNKG